MKILAISGSTRSSSSNLTLIKSIADLAKDIFTIEIFDGLSGIPHFNPDLDNKDVAPEVTSFRHQLRNADGILICTPEYALGVPGSLKNAIDWTVSSMEFSQKPVALITASSSGERAHQSLLSTLLIIESQILPDTQLHIPFIRTKLSADGKIIDAHTADSIVRLIHALAQLIKDKQAGIASQSLLSNAGINSGKF